MGAVQQRCRENSLDQIESDIQTLASVGHWAKQERQRQLEGLSLLWKLLYGDWKPEKVQMPFLVAPEIRVAKHVMEMLQQLARQMLEISANTFKTKQGPRPPSTPPPAHLLRKRMYPDDKSEAVEDPWPNEQSPTQGFPEQAAEQPAESGEAEAAEAAQAAELQSELPAEPGAPDFERQQQEFEHQKHQLQQELAVILQRREALGQRVCGMELLQELEQANAKEPGGRQCQELQEQLQHELHMSQQQQLCQQMLQQLELEMELQRQEVSAALGFAGEQRAAERASSEAVPKRDDELRAEFHHCSQQFLEQVAHLQLLSNEPGELHNVDLDEQRQMLWTYLQAELNNPQSESSKRPDGKGRGLGKGAHAVIMSDCSVIL